MRKDYTGEKFWKLTVLKNYKHWFAKRWKMKRIYRIWEGMKDRCLSNKRKAYKWYWWRWITICDEWKEDFMEFYRDMWKSYEKHVKEFWEKNTSIDRTNNDWNYCKENCRWATWKVQANNKRPKWYPNEYIN